MGNRKGRYQPKSFESTGTGNDVSANLYRSMIESDAFLDLSANQQRLYVFCKLQFYGQKKAANMEPEQFYFNRGIWQRKYRLYKAGNERAFYRDMGALISHGFIACVKCGAFSRTKTVYRFSDRWRTYGTEFFVVPNEEKTVSLRRKESQ